MKERKHIRTLVAGIIILTVLVSFLVVNKVVENTKLKRVTVTKLEVERGKENKIEKKTTKKEIKKEEPKVEEKKEEEKIVDSYKTINYTVKYSLSGTGEGKALVIVSLTGEESKYATLMKKGDSTLSENGKVLTLKRNVELGKEYTEIIEIKLINAPNGFIINPKIEVKEEKSEKNKQIVAPEYEVKTTSIEGIVQDTDGNIKKGEEIELLKIENGVEKKVSSTFSDEKGIYVFSKLEEGEYIVKSKNGQKLKINVIEGSNAVDVLVKEEGKFNIAVKKYVEKVKVIENGKEKEYTYEHAKKAIAVMKGISKAKLEIEYKIVIENKSDKEGYVKTIKEYLPENFKIKEGENFKESNGVFYNKEIGKEKLHAKEKKELKVVLESKGEVNAKEYINKVEIKGEEYHTVTYVVDDKEVKSITVTDSDKIDDIKYEKDCIEVTGWYIDKELTKPFDFSMRIEKDTILYGKYKAKETEECREPEPESTVNKFTVRYIDEEEEYYSEEVEENNKALGPKNLEGETISPSKEGQEFLGWYLGEVEFNFDTLITENITLYSRYNITDVPVITANPSAWTNGNVTVTITKKIGMNTEYKLVDGENITPYTRYTESFELEKNQTVVARYKSGEETSEEATKEIKNIDKNTPILTKTKAEELERNSITLNIRTYDAESRVKEINVYLDENNNGEIDENELKCTKGYTVPGDFDEPGEDLITYNTCKVNGLIENTEYGFIVSVEDFAGNKKIDNNIKLKTSDPVAEIISLEGNTEVTEENPLLFGTLQKAIDYCEDKKCTVRMIKNVSLTSATSVSENQDVTLDTNGHNIAGTTNVPTIENRGVLQILDNNADDVGKIISASYDAISNKGSLTIGYNEAIDEDTDGSVVSVEEPYIKGLRYGVITDPNKTFKFYDGKIEGGVAAINGSVTNKPYLYNVLITPTEESQIATLQILEDGEARIKRTQEYYSRVNTAVSDTYEGTTEENLVETDILSEFKSFNDNEYFKKEEVSTLTDFSGNGNHGLIHGATFNPEGGYLEFDGQDDYVEIRLPKGGSVEIEFEPEKEGLDQAIVSAYTNYEQYNMETGISTSSGINEIGISQFGYINSPNSGIQVSKGHRYRISTNGVYEDDNKISDSFSLSIGSPWLTIGGLPDSYFENMKDVFGGKLYYLKIYSGDEVIAEYDLSRETLESNNKRTNLVSSIVGTGYSFLRDYGVGGKTTNSNGYMKLDLTNYEYDQLLTVTAEEHGNVESKIFVTEEETTSSYSSNNDYIYYRNGRGSSNPSNTDDWPRDYHKVLEKGKVYYLHMCASYYSTHAWFGISNINLKNVMNTYEENNYLSVVTNGESGYMPYSGNVGQMAYSNPNPNTQGYVELDLTNETENKILTVNTTFKNSEGYKWLLVTDSSDDVTETAPTNENGLIPSTLTYLTQYGPTGPYNWTKELEYGKKYYLHIILSVEKGMDINSIKLGNEEISLLNINTNGDNSFEYMRSPVDFPLYNNSNNAQSYIKVDLTDSIYSQLFNLTYELYSNSVSFVTINETPDDVDPTDTSGRILYTTANGSNNISQILEAGKIWYIHFGTERSRGLNITNITVNYDTSHEINNYINNKSISTLNEEADTVELLKNIEMTSDIEIEPDRKMILDLRGYNLNNKNINNNGDLTIIDSKYEKSISNYTNDKEEYEQYLNSEEYELDSKINAKFDYTGDVQEYIVPETGTYKLETWGAGGGHYAGSDLGTVSSSCYYNSSQSYMELDLENKTEEQILIVNVSKLNVNSSYKGYDWVLITNSPDNISATNPNEEIENSETLGYLSSTEEPNNYVYKKNLQPGKKYYLHFKSEKCSMKINSISLNGKSISLTKLQSENGNYKFNNVSLSVPGGYSSGEINLQKGDKLYVYVGGSGNSSGTYGGFNGGGKAIYGYGNQSSMGRSGGGATDIRIANKSLYSRVIVAGGGAGTSLTSFNDDNKTAGVGGGINGGNGYASNVNENTILPSGGTQISGGNRYIYNSNTPDSYTTNGKFGVGGNLNSSNYTSAGGGGWYGGGASSTSGTAGGGSGWTYTEENYNNWLAGNPDDANKYELNSSNYLSNTQMKSGNEVMPSYDGDDTMIGNPENGYAKITFLDENKISELKNNITKTYNVKEEPQQTNYDFSAKLGRINGNIYNNKNSFLNIKDAIVSTNLVNKGSLLLNQNSYLNSGLYNYDGSSFNSTGGTIKGLVRDETLLNSEYNNLNITGSFYAMKGDKKINNTDILGGVFVTNGTVEMTGGSVTDNGQRLPFSDYVIYVSNAAKFIINSGELKFGANSYGFAYVNSNSSFIGNGGTIRPINSTSSSQQIFRNFGTVHLKNNFQVLDAYKLFDTNTKFVVEDNVVIKCYQLYSGPYNSESGIHTGSELIVGKKDGIVNNDYPKLMEYNQISYGSPNLNIKMYDGVITTYHGSQLSNVKETEDGYYATNIVEGTFLESNDVVLKTDDEDVAEINGIIYHSLKEAFDAVNESDSNEEVTIKMLKTRMTKTITLNEGKKVVLDLNGFNTSTFDDNLFINNGELRIIDSTIVNDGDIMTLGASRINNKITNNGKLTIAGGTYEGAKKDFLINNGELIIENGLINTNISNNGTLNLGIKGDKDDNNQTVVNTLYPTITSKIKSTNNILNYYDGQILYKSYEENPIIGLVNEVEDNFELVNETNDDSIRIYLVKSTPIVEVNNNEQYYSLTDAINSDDCANECTIKYLRNNYQKKDDVPTVNSSQNIEINLNNKEIELYNNNNFIINQGILKLENGKINGNDVVFNNENRLSLNKMNVISKSKVINGGTLNINNSNIKTTSNNINTVGLSGNNITIDCTDEELCKFEPDPDDTVFGDCDEYPMMCQRTYGTIDVKNINGSTITINNGTIYSKFSNYYDLAINGGIIYGTTTLSTHDSTIENEHYTEINGGKIYQETEWNNDTTIQNNGQLKITGGVINVPFGGATKTEKRWIGEDRYSIYNQSGSINITGGNIDNIGIRYGSATVNGGNIGEITNSGRLNVLDGEILNIENNSTTTLGKKGDGQVSVTSPKINVFSNNGIFNFYDGVITDLSGDVTDVETNYRVTYNDNKYYLIGNEIVEVNNIRYSSFNDAVNSCSDDCTIKFIVNIYADDENIIIPENKNITIDYNGFVPSGSTLNITNNGTLLITDSSETNENIKYLKGNNISITNNSNLKYKDVKFEFPLTNNGTVEVDNSEIGSIISTAGNNKIISSKTKEITNSANSVLNITNSTINGEFGRKDITNYSNNTIEISNSNIGEIYSRSGNINTDSNIYEVEINDGTISTTAEINNLITRVPLENINYIDGNIHNLTTYVSEIITNKKFDRITSNNEMTINGGTIGSITNNNIMTINGGTVGSIENNKTLTVETVECSSITNKDTMLIKDGTFINTENKTLITNSNKLTIENGTYETTGNTLIKNTGTLKVFNNITMSANTVIDGGTIFLGIKGKDNEEDENIINNYPIINGTEYGIKGGKLYYYDGKITGAKDKSFTGEIMDTEPGYWVRRNELDNNMEEYILEVVGDSTKAVSLPDNNLNFIDLQSAINAVSDNVPTKMVLYRNITLDKDIVIPAGKIINFYFDDYSIDKNGHTITNNGTFNIMDNDTSNGSLLDAILRLLNIDTTPKVTKNAIVYELSDGSKLSSGKTYKLSYLDGEEYKTIDVSEILDDVGRYNVATKESKDVMTPINGLIYVNGLNEGQYKITEIETNKEGVFTVTNEGKVTGNAKENYSSKELTASDKTSTSTANVLLNIQTGMIIFRYGFIATLLVIILSLLIAAKKSVRNN